MILGGLVDCILNSQARVFLALQESIYCTKINNENSPISMYRESNGVPIALHNTRTYWKWNEMIRDIPKHTLDRLSHRSWKEFILFESHSWMSLSKFLMLWKINTWPVESSAFVDRTQFSPAALILRRFFTYFT